MDTSVPPGPWCWLPATSLLSSIQLIRTFPCSKPRQSSLRMVQDAVTAEPRGTMGEPTVTEAQPSVPAGRKNVSQAGKTCHIQGTAVTKPSQLLSAQAGDRDEPLPLDGPLISGEEEPSVGQATGMCQAPSCPRLPCCHRSCLPRAARMGQAAGDAVAVRQDGVDRTHRPGGGAGAGRAAAERVSQHRAWPWSPPWLWHHLERRKRLVPGVGKSWGRGGLKQPSSIITGASWSRMSFRCRRQSFPQPF